ARLAAARGYRPARYLHDLEVDLEAWRPRASNDDDGTSPAPGTAVSSRPLDVADRVIVEATRRAHNEAFADQSGASERDPATWAAQLLSAAFRPELSRVALREAAPTPRGASVDSYVLSCEYAPGELYVSLVGTRRFARGRGLASRLLGDVLAAAKAAGYRSAALGVDAEGPADAVGLYERVGFRRVRSNVVYEKSFLGLAVRPSVAQLPGQPQCGPGQSQRAGRRSRTGLAVSA
ncbi:GNAT family N-acetyltransferase, partial [Sinomonas sp. G460-2]|uniref:GNAT family N-acetyltransferase n=1 Tax=Sinomonas sp. G460-2 TaxID=3393464 RepID=UPI0039F0FFAC